MIFNNDIIIKKMMSISNIFDLGYFHYIIWRNKKLVSNKSYLYTNDGIINMKIMELYLIE